MATTRKSSLTRVNADWRSGARAENMMGSGYRTSQRADSHLGLLDYYMPKFYELARGHVTNKYHVGLYGPYVDEALRVMDQNAAGDKYDAGRKKYFPDTSDNFRKTLFDQWLKLHYEETSGVLNMFWASKAVKIPNPTAKTEMISMDSIKSMQYPVITGINSDNTLTIDVVDDPYLMWYNFFNALFNVQFSPLLLKPRSSLQKINVIVEMFTEGVTATNSMKSIEERDAGNICMTDLVIGQMFEFNSCISTSAPNVNLDFQQATPYTFTVSLKYPNAFQGSFKDQLRYLADETTLGVDPDKREVAGLANCTQTLKKVGWNPYGDYNRGFFEVPLSTWTKRYNNAIYEAFQPNAYMKLVKNGQAAFKNVKYNYDLHGHRR
jgi:hypothetical protein